MADTQNDRRYVGEAKIVLGLDVGTTQCKFRCSSRVYRGTDVDLQPQFLTFTCFLMLSHRLELYVICLLAPKRERGALRL